MLPRMAPPAKVQAEIDLHASKYQASLNAYRNLLETSSVKTPYLLIALRTPADDVVELQVRQEDAYVIGFKGADGWYVFDDQAGGWGKPCGVKSSYTVLGKVGDVVYKDLESLGEFAAFKKGKTALDQRLCPILFVVTSEAARFATVATYFVGITNKLGPLAGGVNFEYLKNTYLNHWAKPPEDPTELNKVYTSVKKDILLPRYKS
jgi:hypothetical protein